MLFLKRLFASFVVLFVALQVAKIQKIHRKMKNVAIKFAGLRKKYYLCTRKFGAGLH